ncbi:MAG: hypothetical protein MUC87_09120 [Bacteroidia bacterium]|jgi:hypothetical protein|nr:hypothetical protein [Bacteroidia bacterium]
MKVNLFARYSLPLVFLLSVTYLCLTESCGDQNPQSTKRIITPGHIHIPASHIFLIPPPGFELSENEPKLVFDSSVYISINEINVNSYYKVIERETSQYLFYPDKNLLRHERFKINEDSARYVERIDYSGDEIKVVLFVGNESYFSTLYCTFPTKDSSKLLEPLRVAFHSFIRDTTVDPDFLHYNSFTMNTKGSSFEVVQKGLDFINLKRKNTRFSLSDTLAPYFVIYKRNNELIQPDTNTKALLADLVEDILKLREKEITHQFYFQKVPADGINAFETEFSTINKYNYPRRYYIMLVRNDKQVFVLTAGCQDKDSTEIADFRKLAHTFRFK